MRMRLSEVVSIPRLDLEKRIRDSAEFRARRRLGMTPQLFREGLRRFGVRAVSLNKLAKLGNEVRGVLGEAGFERRHVGNGYEVWVRDAPW